MAQEFTIKQVSKNTPETWQSKFGPMEKYMVKLGGVDEPVAVNKKPGNAPRAGDVLYGTVEKTPYGNQFRREDKPEFANKTSQSGTTSSYTPRDDKAIQAQFAIKTAVNVAVALDTADDMSSIEAIAVDLFNMVGRVKQMGVNNSLEPTTDLDPPGDLNDDGGFGPAADDEGGWEEKGGF